MIEHLKHRLNAGLEARGKKPAPFAVEVGLKPDVIRDIFRKNTMPSAERLAVIADGLDVSIDYLLGRTDDPSSSKRETFSGEEAIKDALSRIDKLPPGAIQPIWRMIDGYIKDAEAPLQNPLPVENRRASRRHESEPSK